MAEPRSSRASVRARTTAAAVLVVGLATVVGAGVLLALLREALLDQVEIAARVRAAEIGGSVGAGVPLRALGGTEDLLVQLVDPAGTVVDASPGAVGLPVLARPLPDDAAEVDLPGGSFVTVSREVTTPAGARLLLVALGTGIVAESTGTVAVLAAVGVPLVLLVVGATTWVLVGRALGAVEAIRREVPPSPEPTCAGACPSRAATTRSAGWPAR